jgi:hypothetical protein
MVTHGGDALVMDALGRVPRARSLEIKTGWRSSRRVVSLGDRRFGPHGDGRIAVEHEVSGVVLSTSLPTPSELGAVVAEVLVAHVAAYGSAILPEVEVAVAGLQAGLAAGS